MAYVKYGKPIKSKGYLRNAISYVSNEEKTEIEYEAEGCLVGKSLLVTGINCNDQTAYEEFNFTKELYNKTEGILAHHIIQSFTPGEVDPETAHEIGYKFVEKIAPGYQVVIGTHVDKGHIHNHIIVNSVNMETGLKYNDCTSELKFIRNESDKLCREYELSIIDPKGKGIDQETYFIAEKGESWKVTATKCIDEALENSNTKIDFVNYMKDSGYEVNWQNKNITFVDVSNNRKIRTKKLSEQFGEKYSKEAIEKRLGEVRELEGKTQNSNGDISRNYDERISRVEETDSRNRKEPRTDFEEPKSYLGGTRKTKKRKFENEWERYERATLGKISKVGKLVDDKKQDDTLDQEVRLAAIVFRHLLKSKRYSSKKYNLKKSKGKFKLKQVNISDKRINKNYFGNIEYRKFKNQFGQNKILRISLEEFEKVKQLSDLKYGAFKSGDKINFVVKEKDLESVTDIVGEDKILYKRTEVKGDFEEQIGSIKYKDIINMDGETSYRVMNVDEFDSMSKSDIKFAAFKKNDGKINVAFKKSDSEKIKEVMKGVHKNVLNKTKIKNLSR